MKPNYALNLSPDGIGLWHRSGQGWSFVGEAALDDPELAQRLEFLRRTAAELEPSGITTKLIIPDSQILFRSVQIAGDTDEQISAAVLAEMDGATPYEIDQLAIDWRRLDDGRVALAAVARETLAEAEAFAADHRFNAVSFVGALGVEVDFPGEPFFGESQGASSILLSGESVEADAQPVIPIKKAKTPVSDLPTDEAEPDVDFIEEVDLAEDVESPDEAPVEIELPDPVEEETPKTDEEGGPPLVLTGAPEPESVAAPVSKPTTEIDDASLAIAAAKISEPDRLHLSPPVGDASWRDEGVAVSDDSGPDSVQSQSAAPARSLPFSDDVGISPRGQIMLGLFLIAVAVLLIATVFMRERVAAFFQGAETAPVVVTQAAEEPVDAIDDPLAGWVATNVVPLTGTTTPAVNNDMASVLASKLDVSDSVAGLSQFQAAATATPQITVPLELTALTDLAGAEPAKIQHLVSLPLSDWSLDQAVIEKPDPLIWLDELKGITSVSDVQEHALPLILAQASASVPVIAEMPGRRLISRDVSSTVPGRFESDGALDGATLLKLARLPGKEVDGPLIRRGGSALNSGATSSIGEGGAKRVASLPPRHDVILELPLPRVQSTVEQDNFVYAEIHAPKPPVSNTGSPHEVLAPAPEFIAAVEVPQSGAIVSLAALNPPVPEVVEEPEIELAEEDSGESAVEEPVELIAEAPVENLFDPIRPPLSPLVIAEMTPLLAIRPPLASREAVVEDGAVLAAVETALEAIEEPLEAISDEAELAALVDVDATETDATDAESAEISDVNPILVYLRPQTAEVAPADDADKELVLAAIAPRLRPADVGNRSITASATQTAVRIPTNADAAERATQSSGIRLSRVNLIGISGTSSNRQALVRLSSGRIMKVGIGDRLDGGRVVAVSAKALSYQKNGRTQVLEMPAG